MRNFFVSALDMIISVVAVLMTLGVLFGAYTAFSADPESLNGFEIGGLPIPAGVTGALIVLVGGFINVIVVVGFLYLGTGIYKNTKRTADAVEAMLSS